MARHKSPTSLKRATDTGPLRREDLVLEELDGEAILYDPRYGAIHRFNAVALFIWDLCDGSHTVEDMAERLTQVCDVPPDKATESVRRVIAELCTLDVLVHVPSEPVNTEADARWTESPEVSPRLPSTKRTNKTQPLRLSRRRLLGCGLTKAFFVAPVVSTFFASGAYASGPSASAAFGDGGCKTVSYSCSVNNDCCEGGTKTACQDGVCCVQHNESGCTLDSDCCNGPDSCVAGVCQ